MNSNNHVWKKLNESSDLTRDLLTIYNKDFFVELTNHFDADPDPLGLLDATLDTARAYIHGWHKKRANKSSFGNFSGRHILKAGVAARNLEYSLSQISKSDLASFLLNWNLENDANGKSQKADQILNYIKTRYGPADPLDIYRIFSGAMASAANDIIPLPDDDETEKQYIARGDEYSKVVQSDKWSRTPKLSAHYALDQAAITFKPLWKANQTADRTCSRISRGRDLA